MHPIPTNLTPSLPNLGSIRCICFDLYGTLFQSAAGEISDSEHPTVSLEKILHEPLDFNFETEKKKLILEEHSKLRTLGHEYPEIDIVSIWSKLLSNLPHQRTKAQIMQLIRVYEAINHPTAAMPSAIDCLNHLQTNHYELGIISNAQFYTHDLFERHLGAVSTELGFETEIYSYQHQHAKPGTYLFERYLEQIKFEPQQVLYIGNDMLNDIQPAKALGMKAALFAGDQRSLRLRHNLTMAKQPDAILTNLSQIPELIN